jgi:hypothetical protein
VRNLIWLLPLSLLGCNNDDKDTADTASGDTDTDSDSDSDTDADTDTDTDADADVCTNVATEMPNAAFSIWMKDTSDIWVVGADAAGDPDGPLVAHYDGSAWNRIVVPGLTSKLQWIWSDNDDTVVMVGAGAHVVTHSISADSWDIQTIGAPGYTLWGVWGPAPNDLWAVAGDDSGALDGAFFHYDGTSWTLAATAPEDGGLKYEVYKVWGRATNDIWAVGTNDLAMHYDGTAWTQQTAPNPTGDPMFTVSGTATDGPYAVGGFGNAVVWKYNGSSWIDDTPPREAIAPKFTGVFDSDAFGLVACGNRGSIWNRDSNGDWAADPRLDPAAPITNYDYHACWIDPNGGTWAVGGNINSATLDHGVITHCGPEAILPFDPYGP